MSVTRIAARYAKSLLDLAQEQNKLETILGDIQAFKSATAFKVRSKLFAADID